MSTPETDLIAPGRPVRLERTAPGFWMTVLGVCLAAIAPLFGFLIGSMLGRPAAEVVLDPLYWGLFGGVIIGALGVLTAVLGGVRLWRHNRDRTLEGARQ